MLSFPVTVRLARETGAIHIRRPTDPGFEVTITPDGGGGRDLYRALAELLRMAGAGLPPNPPDLGPLN